ncbi:MAG: Fe-Mn family superoxide dismutase [Thiohalophilus sp.]|jgi:Fe-Mn family superoxide dismutase
MATHTAQKQQEGYQIAVLPDLPYAKDALEPHLSAETIEYHYGRHHNKYVNTLNDLVAGSEYENMPLEDIIRKAEGKIFNNAAQVWNHTFYWYSFSPNGSGRPTTDVESVLRESFGSFDDFKNQFNNECMGLFGSGWVWLVQDKDGKLGIETGKDAENPIRNGKTPILTCDMWEHAYYIDYRNDKQKYLDAFWQLVDWNVVAQRLAGNSKV